MNLSCTAVVQQNMTRSRKAKPKVKAKKERAQMQKKSMSSSVRGCVRTPWHTSSAQFLDATIKWEPSRICASIYVSTRPLCVDKNVSKVYLNKPHFAMWIIHKVLSRFHYEALSGSLWNLAFLGPRPWSNLFVKFAIEGLGPEMG